MDIDKLVNEIIPPADYQHRNGFNNIPRIDKLTSDQKQLLEQALIKKLELQKPEEVDRLIIETLGYLKSKAALSVLKTLLEVSNDNMIKLSIATAIFEIDHDGAMINIAIELTKQMDTKKEPYYKYDLISAFYYLATFKNGKTNEVLKEYSTHPDYLISYNARQALNPSII
jgi:hypothetical protein